MAENNLDKLDPKSVLDAILTQPRLIGNDNHNNPIYLYPLSLAQLVYLETINSYLINATSGDNFPISEYTQNITTSFYICTHKPRDIQNILLSRRLTSPEFGKYSLAEQLDLLAIEWAENIDSSILEKATDVFVEELNKIIAVTIKSDKKKAVVQTD